MSRMFFRIFITVLCVVIFFENAQSDPVVHESNDVTGYYQDIDFIFRLFASPISDHVSKIDKSNTNNHSTQGDLSTLASYSNVQSLGEGSDKDAEVHISFRNCNPSIPKKSPTLTAPTPTATANDTLTQTPKLVTPSLTALSDLASWSWIPNCDINADGAVDEKDILLIYNQWHKTPPDFTGTFEGSFNEPEDNDPVTFILVQETNLIRGLVYVNARANNASAAVEVDPIFGAASGNKGYIPYNQEVESPGKNYPFSIHLTENGVDVEFVGEGAQLSLGGMPQSASPIDITGNWMGEMTIVASSEDDQRTVIMSASITHSISTATGTMTIDGETENFTGSVSCPDVSGVLGSDRNITYCMITSDGDQIIGIFDGNDAFVLTRKP
jgi:hypothetical protein